MSAKTAKPGKQVVHHGEDVEDDERTEKQDVFQRFARSWVLHMRRHGESSARAHTARSAILKLLRDFLVLDLSSSVVKPLLAGHERPREVAISRRLGATVATVGHV
jgi:hypothetical protein